MPPSRLSSSPAETSPATAPARRPSSRLAPTGSGTDGAAPTAALPASPEPRRTRSEILRLQLAEEIVSGAIEPGTPLDEQVLATRFGVSRTPVREAIRQLSASGLVSVRPHRGAVVALPTPRQLNDMFEAMAELEALCAGLAARNMTAEERQALGNLHEEMRLAMQAGDQTGYRERNEAFHASIYAGTHNGYLAEMTLMTRARVAPFRHAQFRAAGRLSGSHEEHDRVVRAILAGDHAAATDAMRAHIGIVRDAFRNYVEAR